LITHSMRSKQAVRNLRRKRRDETGCVRFEDGTRELVRMRKEERTSGESAILALERSRPEASLSAQVRLASS